MTMTLKQYVVALKKAVCSADAANATNICQWEDEKEP
jgi:hypothetical protein